MNRKGAKAQRNRKGTHGSHVQVNAVAIVIAFFARPLRLRAFAVSLKP